LTSQKLFILLPIHYFGMFNLVLHIFKDLTRKLVILISIFIVFTSLKEEINLLYKEKCILGLVFKEYVPYHTLAAMHRQAQRKCVLLVSAQGN